MNALRAAVVGVGHLGRFHARKYHEHPAVDLIGVVDTDSERAVQVAKECGTEAFTVLDQVLDKVDLLSIAVPTRFHFEVAKQCLGAGCHILLEKPITQTVAEADQLIETARQANLVFQVGHLERFNPAVIALEGVLANPQFIESHRLSVFKPRGTDVNVVLDLMIHDIDILLRMVPHKLKTINSVGVPVLSAEVDIANARLQFTNGCVANVTASRVSREPTRKMRIFQQDAYITIDFEDRKITLFRKDPGAMVLPGLPGIGFQELSFEQGDPLRDEIHAFIDAVRNGWSPVVTGEEGKYALEVAMLITEKLWHEVSC
jgi:predicted dehydrogenase